MSLSRSWLGALLLAGAVACVATGAEARRLRVEPTWRAVEGCPGPLEFASQVQRRFGPAGLEVPLDFVIAPANGKFVMTVKAGEGLAPRRIASHTCEDLLEAALLMIGMARDVPPDSVEQTSPRNEPEQAEATPSTNAPSARTKKAAKRSPRQPKRRQTQNRRTEPTTQAEVVEEAAVAESMPEIQPTTPASDPVATEKPEEEEVMRVEATADAAPRLRRAARPSPQPRLGAALGLGMGLRAPIPNYLRVHGHLELSFKQLSLRLGTTIMPSTRQLRDTWVVLGVEDTPIEVGNIEVSYFGWSVDSSLCWRFRGEAVRSGRQRVPLSFPVCAGVGMGAWTARSYSEQLVGDQIETLAFWKVETSAAVDWHFAEQFQWSLGLGVELLPRDLVFKIEDEQNQRELGVCCNQWFAFQVSTAVRFAGPTLKRRRGHIVKGRRPPRTRRRRAPAPTGGVR